MLKHRYIATGDEHRLSTFMIVIESINYCTKIYMYVCKYYYFY